ncbi:hypothetical protein J2Z83_003129 [Virgibacillus natechei]|uniref:Uncharacterized protein n=1 Tax=Virgibacillus natechei TaxID=1216297 RepID=A0ABS4IJ93_9BACI|nr:hypothetical protein [Virgibacillus natechei]MBP1970992.1 hypothetical protein [Virgibacillus natechei]UZD12755.1 hypothetical protein OLD84_17985 [Virgibacillus natechei]
MTNFERLKSLDSEYEMADLILYVLSINYSQIIKGDGTLEGLPLLRWLQEEYKEGERSESEIENI